MPLPAILVGATTLLPILAKYAPALIGHLVGERAGQVAEAATQIITEATGVSDPATAASVLEGMTPEQLSIVQVQLASLAADLDKARLQHEINQAKIDLENTQDARRQTLELARMGSALSWIPAFQTVAVTLGFFGVLFALVLNISGVNALHEGFKDALLILLGALAVEFRGACQYWIGGSNAGGMAAKVGIQQAASNQRGSTEPTRSRSIFS